MPDEPPRRTFEKRIAVWTGLDLDEVSRRSPLCHRARQMFITGELSLFDALAQLVVALVDEHSLLIDRVAKIHWSNIPGSIKIETPTSERLARENEELRAELLEVWTAIARGRPCSIGSLDSHREARFRTDNIRDALRRHGGSGGDDGEG